jgi:hypothetical protein
MEYRHEFIKQLVIEIFKDQNILNLQFSNKLKLTYTNYLKNLRKFEQKWTLMH